MYIYEYTRVYDGEERGKEHNGSLNLHSVYTSTFKYWHLLVILLYLILICVLDFISFVKKVCLTRKVMLIILLVYRHSVSYNFF